MPAREPWLGVPSQAAPPLEAPLLADSDDSPAGQLSALLAAVSAPGADLGALVTFLESLRTPSSAGSADDALALVPRAAAPSPLALLPDALLRLLSPYAASFQAARPLGRGGFGSLVSATGTWDGRRVAVKRVNFFSAVPPFAPPAALTVLHEPLLREARALGALNHAHVARLHSAWVEPRWERLARVLAGEGASGTGPGRSAGPLLLMDAESNGDGSDGSSLGSSASESDASSPFAALVVAAPPVPRWPYTLFLSMELVDGPSLHAWLAARRDDPRSVSDDGTLAPAAAASAVAIGRQTAAALAHCHARGVLHRDVKPANVVLSWRRGSTAHPRAVLVDFGLAAFHEAAGVRVSTSSDSSSEHTSGLGTAGYAAPEQAGSGYSSSADVYSLGLVLLELLVPWRSGMERAGALAAARQCPCELPIAALESAAGGAAALVAAMLDHAPEQRPSAAAVAASPALRKRGKRGEAAMLRERLAAQERELETLRARLAVA